MFQIKSQHEHAEFDCHPRRQIQNELQKVDIIPLTKPQQKQKARKIRIKSLPGEDPNLYIIADALIPELQESIALLPPLDFQAISVKRKQLQLFVYTSLVEDGRDYLLRLFKTQNYGYVHEMISETVADVSDLVFQQILDGQHQVHRIVRAKKQDIFNGGNKVTQAAIRIRQQMLKAKISDLKSDINASNLNISSNNHSQFLNLNSADLFSQNNHRTKQAKQFVKRMQFLQSQQRRQRDLKEELKRQKKLQQEDQRKQIEQRVKRQKHEYLKQQFQQKRQAKEQEKKQQQQKNAQFQKFLQQYKGKLPLYKQKQKQFFMKYIVPQNNKKLQILKQIREDRKPLSHEQLKQHEKQYLQIKEDHMYEKNAAKAVQQKTKKPQKIYYKSKFHSLIEKQEKEKEQVHDDSQVKIKMYEKRLEYSNEIKTKFVPKIDLRKKEQMAKIHEELSWIEKVRANKSTNIDSYKKDGKDNLQKLHKYIGELKAKGKIRSTSRTIQTSPQTNSARYKNYLHEMRQTQTSSNMRRSKAYSIDYSSLLASSEDAEKVKINLKKKEESALRRQQYLANLGGKNLQRYMEEKKKLDDDYLEAVKAKMAIINKFQ